MNEKNENGLNRIFLCLFQLSVRQALFQSRGEYAGLKAIHMFFPVLHCGLHRACTFRAILLPEP